MEEKKERELKLLIATASRAGNLISFTANRQNDLYGHAWLLEITTPSDTYKLIVKRNHERRFKTLDTLAKTAKEFGASKLIIKF